MLNEELWISSTQISPWIWYEHRSDTHLMQHCEFTVNNANTILINTLSCLQLQWFSDYIGANRMFSQSQLLRKVGIFRLKLPWRNDWNVTDCGVYAMRHMEEYMGQKPDEWHIGLTKDSTKRLVYLRVRYCRTLLTSEINQYREQNMAAAKEKFPASVVSKFDKFLEGMS